MKITTYKFNNTWNEDFDVLLNTENSLLFVFASAKKTIVEKALKELVLFFSKTTVIGASTAGEILQDELSSDTIVVAVVTFHSTRIQAVTEQLAKEKDSYQNGVSISKKLLQDDLKAIFILSDGLNTNGSKLTQGVASVCGKDIIVTGGLAGDDHYFEKTFLVINGALVDGHVSAVGLYGEHIHIGYGSGGGWDNLGIKRLVTKAKDNILYELDSQPALDIYKRYLGERASELPAIGVHFPIELTRGLDKSENTIRTILGINEEDKSIIFAGDVTEGNYATLMRANYDRLIDGASSAAEQIILDKYDGEEVLSIAISCVGRKLVLKQRTEEELEAVLDVLPPKTKQIGFYSYGEISPLSSGFCHLHNETMTLTLLWEDDA